jgi:hypothetical protein
MFVTNASMQLCKSVEVPPHPRQHARVCPPNTNQTFMLSLLLQSPSIDHTHTHTYTHTHTCKRHTLKLPSIKLAHTDTHTETQGAYPKAIEQQAVLDDESVGAVIVHRKHLGHAVQLLMRHILLLSAAQRFRYAPFVTSNHGLQRCQLRAQRPHFGCLALRSTASGASKSR